MDTLRSGAAAVANGISSLAAGVTGTEASRQVQIHKEHPDYIKSQTEQEQIHREGTEYIKDQVFNKSPSAENPDGCSATGTTTVVKDRNASDAPGQQEYGLPPPPGSLPVDPATSNSGLSFKHPGEELDRTQSEKDERNRPGNTDLIRNDPASNAAAGAPDALHRPFSKNEPHGKEA
ncbi:uncharacterized protein MYCFIDRAFT_211011 [Pseudocercospora fijiensis CIRAD86]|uniref:Uncharacterized protein n=1 Tax=Pseudocercospora fijiensis (strain CIRAD86) TaxID=383855 RepID=M3B6D1_PSEFD|nr:uncharacterized protein MYCFIDRAFT_211011 [Pseudocercospora fijiensis CIRAD86]EME84922.1 hypothetical protein MYCFIDRAFT_211011 [Pseudocercospora fijiensis CIRAD86]